jgi:PAS domain S-box-containing protein
MGSKRHLLLVEDQAIIALDEARRLERSGFAVTRASTGEEAVAVATEQRGLDLVLMDIDLGPGMDGTEAARRILSIRDIPIVFLTGHAEREMVDRVRGITRYGYVLKNSGDFVLMSSIEMAFELYDAHRRTRRHRQLLSRAEEIAHLGSWSIDLRSEATYWSDETFRICGYEPGAYRPTVERAVETVHPGDRERVARELERAMSKGERFDAIFRILRPNGEVRIVQGEAEPSVGPAGDLLEISGSLLDVTERRLAETKYRTFLNAIPIALSEEDFSEVKKAVDGLPPEAKADLRRYFESRPALLAAIAAKAKVIDVNEEAVALYRARSKEDLLGNITKVFGSDSYDGILRAIETIAAGALRFSMEKRHYALDGEPVDIRLDWTVLDEFREDYSRVLVAGTVLARRPS